ncbi:hypothetical protein [Actinocorallia sp. A-T 12471]|uniref:hypothetical protein n=1 Tax=Actinocorallia sp. A-T 12471 TaxID=3089813 RepID=UPI0029D2E14B|nr:hypothetical protein [Actinocorallia sp. A-T 12471]MDX6744986.1 hypothetical protein [Actinocorallia sp. A-T 12471]
MDNRLTRNQLVVLKAEFPNWRVRPVSGRWIAAREGFSVVVRETALEMRNALRLHERAHLIVSAPARRQGGAGEPDGIR